MKGNKTLIIVLALFVVGFILVPPLIILYDNQSSIIISDYNSTRGIVKYETNLFKGEELYYPIVTYSVDGIQYTWKSEIGYSRTVAGYSEGSEIFVYYKDGKPSEARVPDIEVENDADSLEMIFHILIWMCILIGILVGVLLLSKFIRFVMLLVTMKVLVDSDNEYNSYNNQQSVQGLQNGLDGLGAVNMKDMNNYQNQQNWNNQQGWNQGQQGWNQGQQNWNNQQDWN